MNNDSNKIFEYFKTLDVIAYRPGIGRIIGAIPALFLSQAVYWQSKAGSGKWWIKIRDCKKDKNGNMLRPKNIWDQSWEWELGISRSEQESARRKLCALNLIEEKLMSVPARLHFKVNENQFIKFLQENNLLETSHNPEGRNLPSSWVKMTNKKEENSPTNYIDNNIIKKQLQKEDLINGLIVEEIIKPYFSDLVKVIENKKIDDLSYIQDLLDEVAGAMQASRARDMIGDPAGWLEGVLKKGFRKSRCVRLQQKRDKIQEIRNQIMKCDVTIDPKYVTKGKIIYDEILKRNKAIV